MPTPRIRTWTGKLNNMEYTSFQSPDLEPVARKAFTPGLTSIRRLGLFEKPPILSRNDVVLPSVPTLRKTGTGTQTRPTFFTNASSKHSYTLTTHLIPSAYPRTPVPAGSEPIDTTEYEGIVNQSDKSVREGLTASYMDGLIDWSNEVNDLGENGGGGGISHEKNRDKDANGYRKACEETKRVLWNCVNRIVRLKEDKKDEGREKITFFVTHANGFPKEVSMCVRVLVGGLNDYLSFQTYEPAIQSLLTQFEETYSQNSSPLLLPIIDEIWLFEAIQHGDTGLINTGLLPRACKSTPTTLPFNTHLLISLVNCLDNVRDILRFLLYYIPDRVDRDTRGEVVDLPTHLTRLPDEAVSRRINEGFPYSKRKMVGIGHSLGGCSVYV